MEIHQKISFPNYQNLNGEKEKRSETSITNLWRQAWENWIRSNVKESKGHDWRWRRKKVSVANGKQKASVRNETVEVSATRPKIVRKNQKTLPPPLLSQPHHEVEVFRGREVSEAKITMGPFFDNPQISFEKYVHANVLWTLASSRVSNIKIRIGL